MYSWNARRKSWQESLVFATAPDLVSVTYRSNDSNCRLARSTGHVVERLSVLDEVHQLERLLLDRSERYPGHVSFILYLPRGASTASGSWTQRKDRVAFQTTPGDILMEREGPFLPFPPRLWGLWAGREAGKSRKQPHTSVYKRIQTHVYIDYRSQLVQNVNKCKQCLKYQQCFLMFA